MPAKVLQHNCFTSFLITQSSHIHSQFHTSIQIYRINYVAAAYQNCGSKLLGLARLSRASHFQSLHTMEQQLILSLVLMQSHTCRYVVQQYLRLELHFIYTFHFSCHFSRFTFHDSLWGNAARVGSHHRPLSREVTPSYM